MYLFQFLFHHAGIWQQERADHVRNSKEFVSGLYLYGPSGLIFAPLLPVTVLLASKVPWGAVAAICLWPAMALVTPKTPKLLTLGRRFSTYKQIGGVGARVILVAWGVSGFFLPFIGYFTSSVIPAILFVAACICFELYLRTTTRPPNK